MSKWRRFDFRRAVSRFFTNHNVLLYVCFGSFTFRLQLQFANIKMQLELTEQILKYVDENGKVDSLDLVPILGVEHQRIIGALKSIEANGELLQTEQTSRKTWDLTEEGKSVLINGSHEACVFHAVPTEGIPQADLMKVSRENTCSLSTRIDEITFQTSPNAKVGFSKAMAQGWIVVDKSGAKPLIKRKVDSIVDGVQEHLKQISSGAAEISDAIRNDYKKRKLLQETVTKSFIIAKGKEFSLTLQKLEADLTADMLANGLWNTLKFKPYNLDALGSVPDAGYLHPLLKVRTEFRNIFLEMGFSEMPTNNFVESSFWNFDALFQPQQHPARDAHDTFFLTAPSKSFKFPEEYLNRVKETHSTGGYGSQGYQYDWKLEEAQKNLLRTHTTAVSARMLYKLANQEGGFVPAKYFSIDRVFRNETLDATHLAEFHQVEGVIADRKLTLGDLIGTIAEFFKKLGLNEIEFKPAYNPYTEPSMEIFCFHPGLKKWIEVTSGAHNLNWKTVSIQFFVFLGRKFRDVPPGDAAPDGIARGRECNCLGTVA